MRHPRRPNFTKPRNIAFSCFLIEKPYYLSSDMLSSCLLVIHDARRSCKNDKAKLSGGQELYNPFFEIGDANIVARGDDTGFVDPT